MEFEELKKELSSIYSLHESGIDVFLSDKEYIDLAKKDFKIVIDKLEGDFPFWVNFYGFPEKTDKEIAEHFISMNADISVLISDDTVNPYQWILISKNGNYLVYVNAELLDKYNGFKIEKKVSKL